MNEVNIYDLIADTICVIFLPHDVYKGGFTEGSGTVEGGVRVEECILLCWGLNTGRICGGKKGRREYLYLYSVYACTEESLTHVYSISSNRRHPQIVTVLK